MISSIKHLCCLVAAIALICSSVYGQGQDPFADRDPFSHPVRRSGEVAQPINIVFEVTDHVGAPVQGARIRGPGIFRPLYTQQQGKAVWKTDQQVIRDWAARLKGTLRFHAMPPEAAVMPNVSKLISLSDLLESKGLKFQTTPGVRLAGRVIGQLDQRPVEGVTVVLHPNKAGLGTRATQTTTNQQGEWSIVIPRIDVKMTLRGQIEGYQLQDVPNAEIDDARVVQIPEHVKEHRVADFEIEQLQPLQVLVTDASGQAVPAAKVCAYRQEWLDDQIVVWEAISQQHETGPQGVCLLYLSQPDWEVAMVSATAVVNGANIEGRAILPLTQPAEIRVEVEPHAEIAGTLLKDAKPAAHVKLVLYEAINNERTGWTTIGMRAEAITDAQGNYVFAAPLGLHWIIATKDRDQNDRQTILHRTHPTRAKQYRVPNTDLSDFR